MEHKQTASVIYVVAIAAIAIGLASCAQPERPLAAVISPRTGARFSAEGKVNLYAGQPCASQIMFDFRESGAMGNVQLAAPMAETRQLTDAAKRNRRVRIWGKWRTGRDRGCQYIEVARVETAQ